MSEGFEDSPECLKKLQEELSYLPRDYHTRLDKFMRQIHKDASQALLGAKLGKTKFVLEPASNGYWHFVERKEIV